MAHIDTKLPQLVIDEANKLLQHATLEERLKLNVKIINGSDQVKCIYGMMTGWCFSDRAGELISLCDVQYSVYLLDFLKPSFERPIDSFQRAYTAIEFFIAHKAWKHNAPILVEYLRGERLTLTAEELTYNAFCDETA